MAIFADTDTTEFKRSLIRSVDSIVSRGGDFSIDDVWKELTLRGYENRAPGSAIVGAVLNSYRTRGLIENTGRSQISQRGPAKGRRVSIWKVIGDTA